MRDVMNDAAARAIQYLAQIDERRVRPEPASVARLAQLDYPLPEASTAPSAQQLRHL